MDGKEKKGIILGSSAKSLRELDIPGDVEVLEIVTCDYITDLTPLKDLSSLTSLNISVCDGIRDLAPIKELKNLDRLNLSGIHIKNIPQELFDLQLPFVDEEYGTDIPSINLHNTQIDQQPPSLFFQPRERILEYYNSPKIPIHEAKVIFLGYGGAGKSHTIQRIQNDGKELTEDQLGKLHDSPTKGIEITKKETDDLTINYWDFAGQAILHSMHRCFLTDRTCYVVVVRNRRMQTKGDLMRQARYWLRAIGTFSPQAPILIAVNCDKGTPIDTLDTQRLRAEFPDLTIHEPVSYHAMGEDNSHFEKLQEAIVTMARQMPSYDMEFPRSWIEVRDAVNGKTEESGNCITIKEYHAICKQKLGDQYDESFADWLLSWFNDLGYCFSYKKDYTEDGYVFKPQAVIGAMYNLIEKEQPTDNNDGKIREKYAKRELNTGTMPDAVLDSIIGIMCKKKLCYQMATGSDLFIPMICRESAPELFSENTDDRGNVYNSRTAYIIEYTYLPLTLIYQLMIDCLEKGRGTMQQVYQQGFKLIHEEIMYRVYIPEESDRLQIDALSRNSEGQEHRPDILTLYESIKSIEHDLNISADRDFIEKTISVGNEEDKALFPMRAVIAAWKGKRNELPAYTQKYSVLTVCTLDRILYGVETVVEKRAEEESERSAKGDLGRIADAAENMYKLFSKKYQTDDAYQQKVAESLNNLVIEYTTNAVKSRFLQKQIEKALKKPDYVAQAANISTVMSAAMQLAQILTMIH